MTGNDAVRGAGLLLEALLPNERGPTCCCLTNVSACSNAVNTGTDVSGTTRVYDGVVWLNRPPLLPLSQVEVHGLPAIQSRPLRVAMWDGSVMPTAFTTGVPLPTFTVCLRDVYGNVVSPLADATIIVTVARGHAVVAGTQTSQVSEGGDGGGCGGQCGGLNTTAVFAGLTLLAVPGSQVLLLLSLDPPHGTQAMEVEVAAALCPAGTALGSDRISCTPCPAGDYSPHPNADLAACRTCAGVHGVSGVGSAACTPCTSGLAPDSANEACVACQATYVSNGTRCEPCAVGMVPAAQRVACEPCAAGTIRPSTTLSCTPCAKGQYAAPGHGTCITCPPVGVACSEGFLVVLPGYWRAGASSAGTGTAGATAAGATAALALLVTEDTVFYKCPPDACTLSEDGGAPVCVSGREGPLCAICQAGNFVSVRACAGCVAWCAAWCVAWRVSWCVAWCVA